MNNVMEERSTYTKQDMVKLINEVGANLVLKKDKISLETEIQKKQLEIEYKREYFERVQKKYADLNAALCDMEDRSREIRNKIAQVKVEKEAAISELEEILDLEKKAKVLLQRTSEINTLTERVNALNLKINKLKPEYDEKLREKDRLDRELSQNEEIFSSLNAEIGSLSNRKEHLLSKVPPRDKIAERQKEAELSIVENTSGINSAKGQLKTLESDLPPARALSDTLRRKKEDLTDRRDSLQKRISELTSADSKEDLMAEIEGLTAKKEKLTAMVGGHENKISELTSSIAAAEASIKDEDDFTTKFTKLNEELEARKADIVGFEDQIQGLVLEKEADEKLIEMLSPINEYAGSINNVLAKLTQDYKTAIEKVMLDIVKEVQ